MACILMTGSGPWVGGFTLRDIVGRNLTRYVPEKWKLNTNRRPKTTLPLTHLVGRTVTDYRIRTKLIGAIYTKGKAPSLTWDASKSLVCSLNCRDTRLLTWFQMRVSGTRHRMVLIYLFYRTYLEHSKGLATCSLSRTSKSPGPVTSSERARRCSERRCDRMTNPTIHAPPCPRGCVGVQVDVARPLRTENVETSGPR